MKNKIIPLKGKIFVHNIQKGGRLVGSIWIPDDDGKDSGIRPRWAQVLKVADDIEYVKENEWILMGHGRWSREIKLKDDNGNYFSFWMADPKHILLVSEELPAAETFSNYTNALPEPKY